MLWPPGLSLAPVRSPSVGFVTYVYVCVLPGLARSRLQATSVAIGESFPIPEIVAIGGQSDGKSSLLEAFLGVRMTSRQRLFHVRSAEAHRA